MPKNEKKLKKDLSNEKLVQKNDSSKQNRIAATSKNSTPTKSKCVCPHNVVEASAAVPAMDLIAAAAKAKKQRKKEKRAAAKNTTTAVVKVEISDQAVAELANPTAAVPAQKGKDKKSKAEKKKLTEANNQEVAKV